MQLQNIKGVLAVALLLDALVSSTALSETTVRPTMVGPSPSEDVVSTLTRSLETACQNRDVIGFLSQFTPHRAALIRRPMEDLFICHDVTLEVQDTLILDESESAIVFGIRYSVHRDAMPKQRIASRVTAKRLGATWKIDCEEILTQKASQATAPAQNAPVARVRGGRIPCPGRPDWVPIGIDWMPGGCADGRCGL